MNSNVEEENYSTTSEEDSTLIQRQKDVIYTQTMEIAALKSQLASRGNGVAVNKNIGDELAKLRSKNAELIQQVKFESQKYIEFKLTVDTEIDKLKKDNKEKDKKIKALEESNKSLTAEIDQLKKDSNKANTTTPKTSVQQAANVTQPSTSSGTRELRARKAATNEKPSNDKQRQPKRRSARQHQEVNYVDQINILSSGEEEDFSATARQLRPAPASNKQPSKAKANTVASNQSSNLDEEEDEDVNESPVSSDGEKDVVDLSSNFEDSSAASTPPQRRSTRRKRNKRYSSGSDALSDYARKSKRNRKSSPKHEQRRSSRLNANNQRYNDEGSDD